MWRLTEWTDDKKMLAKSKFSGDFGSHNILQSLAEYEDLEELIGIPLKNLAEICNNKIPEECRNPKKAIVLTDKDADRWSEYKSAEEQGLLLRLPCKDVFESSGDTVYYIFDYEIVECINCGVSIDCEGKVWVALACDEHIFPYRRPMPEIDLDPTDWCNDTTEVSVDEWGKTVFLTKDEAEQKLKEMNTDNGITE